MYGRPASAFATVVGACLALACASLKSHPYEIEADHVGAPGVRTVAVLPLNLVLALPGELEYPSRQVERQITRYLRDTGLQVLVVRLHEARKLLAAGEPADGDDAGARRAFVERLRADRAFDVVVLPSLVYREARVRAVTHEVAWDGVTRELSIVGEHQREYSLSYTADVAGRMPAVSLNVLVYDDRGQRIFESYGGLDLVHEASMVTPGQNLSYQWRLKRHRLEDEDAIREGVAVAFDPYLPILPVQPRE